MPFRVKDFARSCPERRGRIREGVRGVVTAAAAGAAASCPADSACRSPCPGNTAYPIHRSPGLCCMRIRKIGQAKVMVDFVKWAVMDGEAFCQRPRVRTAALSCEAELSTGEDRPLSQGRVAPSDVAFQSGHGSSACC